MGVKATILTMAALGLCLGATSAQAQSQGVLTCQIALGQFAEDVYAAKARLRPNQLDTARAVVDVGRSQCRSGPDLVLTDIQTTRIALNLRSGQHAGSRFSDFWPVSPEELALLNE